MRNENDMQYAFQLVKYFLSQRPSAVKVSCCCRLIKQTTVVLASISAFSGEILKRAVLSRFLAALSLYALYSANRLLCVY